MSQKLSITNLKELCKKDGVFLLSNNQEVLVNTAHLFFWGYNDINFLADSIDDEKNNKKSIRLNINAREGSLAKPYEMIYQRLLARHDFQKETARVKLKKIDEINDNTLEAEYNYTKHQGGRVRLLDEIDKKFTLRITHNNNNTVTIDVTHDDIGDVKIVKDEIHSLVGGENTENFRIKHISLKSLLLDNKILLFDQLFGYKFDEWTTEEIKSIKLVKDKEYFDPDGEEDEKNVDNSILSGINSALLQGTALRTNEFVQNCLKRGYYFSQATIKLAHKIDNIKICIDIIFRGEKRYLEINVSGCYESEDGNDFKKNLPIEDQRQYLRYFHDIISTIHNTLFEQQASRNKPSTVTVQ